MLSFVLSLKLSQLRLHFGFMYIAGIDFVSDFLGRKEYQGQDSRSLQSAMRKVDQK